MVRLRGARPPPPPPGDVTPNGYATIVRLLRPPPFDRLFSWTVRSLLRALGSDAARAVGESLAFVQARTTFYVEPPPPPSPEGAARSSGGDDDIYKENARAWLIDERLGIARRALARRVRVEFRFDPKVAAIADDVSVSVERKLRPLADRQFDPKAIH